MSYTSIKIPPAMLVSSPDPDLLSFEAGLAHRGWHAASFPNAFCAKSSGSRICKARAQMAQGVRWETMLRVYL